VLVRILMFGRGTIATTYGWALRQAGHDVKFLVRPGRVAEYGDTVDLDLLDGRRSPRGARVSDRIPVTLRETLTPDDPFDLVVLSVGHHRLRAAAAFLAPRIGDTTVLVFGNVWDEPADAIAPIPVDQVVWGFPQAGGGFRDDGVLHGALLRGVIIGSTGGSVDSRRGAAAVEAFESAGFRVRREPDMRGWLFLHFVADAGMHAQGLRLGTLSDMIGDRRAFKEALLTTRELLPVLSARGVDIRRHRTATLPYRAPAWLVAPAMATAISSMAIARASLEAHTDPNAAEPPAVVDDVLATADELGIAVPRLEAVRTR
jgi:2-dehydropantoate 2-reductase